MKPLLAKCYKFDTYNSLQTGLQHNEAHFVVTDENGNRHYIKFYLSVDNTRIEGAYIPIDYENTMQTALKKLIIEPWMHALIDTWKTKMEDLDQEYFFSQNEGGATCCTENPTAEIEEAVQKLRRKQDSENFNKNFFLERFRKAFIEFQLEQGVKIDLPVQKSGDIPVFSAKPDSVFQEYIRSGNKIIQLLSSETYQLDEKEALCLEQLIISLEKLDKQKPDASIKNLKLLLEVLGNIQSEKFSYQWTTAEMARTILIEILSILTFMILIAGLTTLIGAIMSTSITAVTLLFIGASIGFVIGLCLLATSENCIVGKKEKGHLEIVHCINPFLSRPDSPYLHFSQSLFHFFEQNHAVNTTALQIMNDNVLQDTAVVTDLPKF